MKQGYAGYFFGHRKHTRTIIWLILILVITFGGSGCTSLHRPHKNRIIFKGFVSDQKEFYKPRSLLKLAASAGVAAGMANSAADQNLINRYDKTVRESRQLDNISMVAKEFGDGRLVIPALALGNLAANTLFKENDTWLGELTERSLRAYLVGAGPLLLGQRVGGSRPNERSGVTTSSPWIIGSDTNAVSGHAFIGAVPFLTAAKMAKSWPAKLAWYGLSALPAWSRMHDNAHYPSQVLMGWSLANLAADAVSRTEENNRIDFAVMPIPGGAFATLGWRF